MARMNWSGDRSRRHARERGTEAAADTIGLGDDDLVSLLAGSPHRPLGRNAPSKAQLRRETATMIHSDQLITLAIRCLCGHSACVTVPAGRDWIRLRCTGCDRRIERKM